MTTAPELEVIERSSEPESTDAGGHIWPRRKQQVSLRRIAEGIGICTQVKARIMGIEMKGQDIAPDSPMPTG